MNQNVRREHLDSGIVVLTFDRPDSTANIFDQATFDDLNGHLTSIEDTPNVKGVILQSAKPKIFIAGADLNGFTQDRSPEALIRLIEQGQRTFDRIAGLPCPTVATVHGIAVGGGLEVALACTYRVLSLDPATKIGLPETMLGILPAWGGSTRLPRMIGLQAALEAILTGKQYSAKQAKKLGIADEITYAERMPGVATKLIQEHRGRGRSYGRHLSNRAPVSNLVASQARKQVLKKSRGLYPAPLKALEVALASLGVSHAASLQNEVKGFVELATGPVAENLIRVFFLQERSKKLKGSVPAAKIKQVLVVGAGLMGSGIAQWLSTQKLHVILRDVSPEALGNGLRSIYKLFREGVKRRALTDVEAKAAADRILPVFQDIPMRHVDLVIEAAVEKLDLKKEIFAALEPQVASAHAIATNTSALSIDAIADGLKAPERVVGIHFFNPVHRMKLVEIVQGARTSPAAIATAIGFAKAIGKLPVLVKDSPGFLVNRILLPYIMEALRILDEGYAVPKIDEIMLNFGMPMGPLRLADEVGLDVCLHVGQDLNERLKDLPPLNDLFPKMIERGWLGRKAGRGFYEYSGSEEKLNSQLREIQRKPESEQVDSERLRDRMVLVMVNEAARCVEEQVVADPSDVDFGMIMGSGWAPLHGGPLKYADSIGLPETTRRLQALAETAGSHFRPCRLLVEMAEVGSTFFSTPDSTKAIPAIQRS